MQHKVLKFSIFFKIFLYILYFNILHVFKNRKKEKGKGKRYDLGGVERSDLTSIRASMEVKF